MTLGSSSGPPSPTAAPPAQPATPLTKVPDPEPAPAPQWEDSEVAPPPAVASGRRAAHATPGVAAPGVWLVVVGVTVVMAFADALVGQRGQLGWLTGIALLAASVYGALVVRRDDDIVAVIAPPLSFFLATITAGQLMLPPSGGLLVREAFMIITTLGGNALWIFGSTLIALAIVAIRRRRQSRSTPDQQP